MIAEQDQQPAPPAYQMSVEERYGLRETAVDYATAIAAYRIVPTTRAVEFLVFYNTHMPDPTKKRFNRTPTPRLKFPVETQRPGETPIQTLKRCWAEEVVEKREDAAKLSFKPSSLWVDAQGKPRLDAAKDPQPFVAVFRDDWKERNQGRHLRIGFLCEVTGDQNLLRKQPRRDENDDDLGMDLLGPPEWREAQSFLKEIAGDGLEFHIALGVRALRAIAQKNRIVEQKYSDFLFSHRPELCKDDRSLEDFFKRLDADWAIRKQEQRTAHLRGAIMIPNHLE